MMSRRQALRLLLGSAGALSLVQCSSSDNNPRRVGGFPINPTSPCNVLAPENEHRATLAIMALAGGHWGFNPCGGCFDSFELVRGLTLRGEITIDISSAVNPCDAECAGHVPTIAELENPTFNAWIVEDFPLRIVASNVLCAYLDYLFAVESSDRNIAGETRFALLWPRTQLMMTSSFEQFGIRAVTNCINSEFDQQSGVAETFIAEWPFLSGLFEYGERITVTAINVLFLCPNGRCNAGARFSLCFGVPFVTTYFARNF